MSGFHLNGLMDYPGEGVALIGVLDALSESKGIATPEQWRQFCSETVPLVRLSSVTFHAGEEFMVPVEVRHHGANDLVGSEWRWSIIHQDGRSMEDGYLCKYDVPTGGLTALGTIRTQLPQLNLPEELTLQVWMDNSEVRNEWQIWVYPNTELEKPSDVFVAGKWAPEVQKRLEVGGKVLLTPTKEEKPRRLLPH